ncbi:hypothetical protein ACFODZ_15845 [Marinicella sediminis]|uniref:Uncharacterized protein n=1 Tax=Marinicella sediminis TaxID=1792834 RepID=A0ABV7JHL7_9GAMM|nr:hypothetical protein [Marinicella sediminis]
MNFSAARSRFWMLLLGCFSASSVNTQNGLTLISETDKKLIGIHHLSPTEKPVQLSLQLTHTIVIRQDTIDAAVLTDAQTEH